MQQQDKLRTGGQIFWFLIFTAIILCAIPPLLVAVLIIRYYIFEPMLNFWLKLAGF